MLALEVVPLPVDDIDRPLAFYTEQVGLSSCASAPTLSRWRVT